MAGPGGVTVYTIGHSTRPFAAFAALLAREGIRCVADVRSIPASRRHPQFNQEPLAAALGALGVDYVHVAALGGRRHPLPDSPNAAWRDAAFRGYADHMATPGFRLALDDLVALAAREATAVMCAEAAPWRCHRSMIADALVARGERVLHVMDARTSPHALTPFAVIEGREVRYRAAGAQEDMFGAG